MDATVNDFLNEINEIAPLSESKEYLWEECYDEESGYCYYWNTKTDEVTWNAPSEYKPIKNLPKLKKSSNSSLYVPPRTAPLFPSTVIRPASDAVKIYKISDNLANSSQTSDSSVNLNSESSSKVVKKAHKHSSDSEDEKIVLISSYGGDSESENEDDSESNKSASNDSRKTQIASNFDKIKQPSLDLNESANKKNLEAAEENRNVPISSGFALVAGYSDSEEESEISETTPIEENKISHSTLFPITKPIDIKDFELVKEDKPNDSIKDESSFDTKAFQRKRRIGVALINTSLKKVKPSTQVDDESSERKGFGFNTNTNDLNNKCDGDSSDIKYPGFKSGGVMFVKSDVLNSGSPASNAENNDSKVVKDIDVIYTTLKEKLTFLSEGKEEVSPIQVMLIQSETLFTAMRSGDLKQNYLKEWLSNTCSDLIKLEKETTPDGWLLQWDRNGGELSGSRSPNSVVILKSGIFI